MPIDFHRPPHLEPPFVPSVIPMPVPPPPPVRERFPAIAMTAPLVVGIAMFAVMPSPLTAAFVALSPLLALGSWLDQRIRGIRSRRTAAAAFDAGLELARDRLQAAIAEERAARLAEDPDPATIVERMLGRAPELWARRPGDEAFLRLRAGLGRQPSRLTTVPPRDGDALAEDRERVERLVRAHADLDGVPVVGSLSAHGSIGIAGRGETARAAIRALVIQLVGHHAPSELRLAAFVDDEDREEWSWLERLPHFGVAPPDDTRIAIGPASRGRLLEALNTSAAERRNAAGAPPALVVLVLGRAVDRSRLLALAGSGRDIHLIWLAQQVSELPAVCGAVLDLGTAMATFCRVDSGERIPLTRLDRLSLPRATAAATSIEELIDADAPDRTDPGLLPGSVPFAEIEPDLATPDGVLARWRRNAPRLALDARLGATLDGPLTIDLRSDGPHAFLGGTTGSGKSELLQSWILSLAGNHGPERLAFLLVDYKGGAAFADCTRLPHAVGIVTDLTARLARRALLSLRAELVRRERILSAAGAKDLVALERRRGPEAPPALVIVIDEFATLATEFPEFIDGVIDIAQRGRSLGLHLVMATQRPAGVIRDSLRANTSLRIALRLADAADSVDVIGTDAASRIRTDHPGRGFARIGPDRPVAFQTAWLGDSVASRVAVIHAAAALAGVSPTRRPWLPELPSRIPLTGLPAGGLGLRIGLLDRPDRQCQPVLRFDPEQDAHLLIVGRSGSGKSTGLRTVATAAAEAALAGEAIRLYAIDAGNGGLAPIVALPIVGEVVPIRDEERVRRTFRMLTEELDRRVALLGGTRPRSPAAIAASPRILLLVDGLGALREGRETRPDDPVLAALDRLLSVGRSVGLHVVVSAERPAAVPSSMLGEFGLRIALRPGSATDAALLGIDAAVLAEAQPGRGLVRGVEGQLATLAQSTEAEEEAARLARLARRLRRAGVPPAPPVPLLEDRVPLARLPPTVAGRPSLGVTVEELAAIGFPDRGVLLVVGRARSGRSTAIRTMLASLSRAGRLTAPVVLTPDAELIPGLSSDALLVIERAHDFAGTPAEPAIAMLLRGVRRAGGLAIVELDPGRIAAAWQLLTELKSADAGIFLRAEEQDALALFRVPLGRARPGRTPPGRAWLVEDGVSIELQLAIADPVAECRDSPRTRQSPVTLAASPP